MRSRPTRAGILATGVALGGACDDELGQRQAANLDQVIHVVEQLRQAPNDAKRPWLDELARTPCDSPKACELQRLCMQAYTLHQSGLDQRDAAARQLEQAPNEARKNLAAATRDLGRARKLTVRCAEARARLTHR